MIKKIKRKFMAWFYENHTWCEKCGKLTNVKNIRHGKELVYICKKCYIKENN